MGRETCPSRPRFSYGDAWAVLRPQGWAQRGGERVDSLHGGALCARRLIWGERSPSVPACSAAAGALPLPDRCVKRRWRFDRSLSAASVSDELPHRGLDGQRRVHLGGGQEPLRAVVEPGRSEELPRRVDVGRGLRFHARTLDLRPVGRHRRCSGGSRPRASRLVRAADGRHDGVPATTPPPTVWKSQTRVVIRTPRRDGDPRRSCLRAARRTANRPPRLNEVGGVTGTAPEDGRSPRIPSGPEALAGDGAPSRPSPVLRCRPPIGWDPLGTALDHWPRRG